MRRSIPLLCALVFLAPLSGCSSNELETRAFKHEYPTRAPLTPLVVRSQSHPQHAAAVLGTPLDVNGQLTWYSDRNDQQPYVISGYKLRTYEAQYTRTRDAQYVNTGSRHSNHPIVRDHSSVQSYRYTERAGVR